jgi:2-amino-4-hydroxy-6-hydroxymethyldihydropteridine diphosphokinase
VQHAFNNGIFLLLGTNLGNRQENLAKAKELLTKKAGEILSESSIYLTKAWGNTAQPDFLNQVFKIKTSLAPEKLLEKILAIELEMGRLRTEKWGSRLIDIDILFYNDLVIQSSKLIVPHPALHKRRFTLIPLAEIAAEFVHPVLNKSIDQLLESCDDEQAVERIGE